MAVSAHDVAREIRRESPRVGNLKLQKLLYYCQGWHLAWTGSPMFVETIEAWANGPVVADFWHDENKGRGAPAPTELPARARQIVGYVLSRYGKLTGAELKELTHRETPWLGASETDSYNPPLTTETLVHFFSHTDGLAEEKKLAADLWDRTDFYSTAPKVMSPERRAVVELAQLQAASGHAGGG